jgi:SH3-like domain-containing protein
MNQNQEKLLVAALAGLIMVGAAAFAVQPALAAGYDVESPAHVVGVKSWDTLNVRKWPASYSQKVGEFEPKSSVWVERCIVSPQGGSDWCLVEQQDTKGWVNAKFLKFAYDWDI